MIITQWRFRFAQKKLLEILCLFRGVKYLVNVHNAYTDFAISTIRFLTVTFICYCGLRRYSVARRRLAIR